MTINGLKSKLTSELRRPSSVSSGSRAVRAKYANADADYEIAPSQFGACLSTSIFHHTIGMGDTRELPRHEPDSLRDVSPTQQQTKTQNQYDKDPMANSVPKIRPPPSTPLPRVNFPPSLGTYTGSTPFCLPLPPDPFHSTGATYTNGSGWAGMSIPRYSAPGAWHGQLAATPKAPNELNKVSGQLGLPTAGLMRPTAHAYGSVVHLANRHAASSPKTPSTPSNKNIASPFATPETTTRSPSPVHPESLLKQSATIPGTQMITIAFTRDKDDKLSGL